jgi:hypothetical protein
MQDTAGGHVGSTALRKSEKWSDFTQKLGKWKKRSGCGSEKRLCLSRRDMEQADLDEVEWMDRWSKNCMLESGRPGEIKSSFSFRAGGHLEDIFKPLFFSPS